MTFKDRLRLLTGETAPAVPPAPAGDLASRLRRLTTSTPRRDVARLLPDEAALAAALGAERLAPGLLRVEHRLALDDRHGDVTLGDALSALPSLLDGGAVDPSGWLFLDTETSGLAGGTGTWAFLFGAARVEGGALVVRQLLLSRLDAEDVYLDAVAREAEGAGLVVTYNGKTFDAPLLSTRFRLVGRDSPLDGKVHLDLLGLVRRAFGRVWPDCRLATAERSLLGLSRVGDLPGSEAPEAWLAWLRCGETARLGGVLAHNRQDLLSLAALAAPIARSLRDPAATGAEIGAVAGYHLARGDEARAFALLLTHRRSLSVPALLALARLHRARGEWEAARAIWEMLAERDEPAAIEALAKYHEHRLRDFVGALRLAERLPAGPERERRCRRLASRLSGDPQAEPGAAPVHRLGGIAEAQARRRWG